MDCPPGQKKVAVAEKPLKTVQVLTTQIREFP